MSSLGCKKKVFGLERICTKRGLKQWFLSWLRDPTRDRQNLKNFSSWAEYSNSQKFCKKVALSRLSWSQTKFLPICNPKFAQLSITQSLGYREEEKFRVTLSGSNLNEIKLPLPFINIQKYVAEVLLSYST